MSTFETSATVGEQGQLQLEGIPFVSGTKVIVQVSEATAAEVADAEQMALRRAHLEELFRTTKGFRRQAGIGRTFSAARTWQLHLGDTNRQRSNPP